MAFQIITDSSWDMEEKKARELHVDVIPFFIAKDGEHYQKEVVELPVRELYQYMVDHPGVYPRTAQPAIEEYLNRFERYAAEGKDIICCTVNQSFSGSFNAAALAKEMTLEKYPDVKIEIVDTMQATLMQGLIVQELALCQMAGVAFDKAVAIVQKIKHTAKIFFTVSGLDYLIHGGRVGKLAGTAANVLNLCPMITLAKGELASAGLARGRKQARKKALQMLIDHIKAHGDDPDRYTYIVGYGYDIDEGDIMHDMLMENLDKNWKSFCPEVEKAQIGATIGVHTGPYPIGFGIVERWNYEQILD